MTRGFVCQVHVNESGERRSEELLLVSALIFPCAPVLFPALII